MWEQYFENNKKLWNEKVDVHLRSDFYRQQAFLDGDTSLSAIELEGLGDVSSKSLLHLQCHFGQDTLSWARMGASVTGVDFSEKAIQAARQIANSLELDARFVLSDIYELTSALTGQFDVVYTSYGTITWLPDLARWAAVVRHFLRPGGTFYIADFHPTLYMFNFDTREVEYGYFTEKNPFVEVVTGTYADVSAPIVGEEFFWNHAPSEIITALLNAGLTLQSFREFDYSPWNCFPNMQEREPDRFVWGDFGVRFPHVFEIKAKG